MAVPIARVHLKMAHAALPALLPTPPKWKKLRVLPTPPPCVAAVVLPKPLGKLSRADTDERWDAHKTKSSTSASSNPRSTSADGVIKSIAVHGSPRKNTTTPPPKPGRADSLERWDAHKKAAGPASSSSSSGTSSLASCSNWPISRASSGERWDVHKKWPFPPQALNDGEICSTGSNGMDTEEEEEIVWKPRAMYAGPGFVGAAPEPSMIPMPTAFLIPVA